MYNYMLDKERFTPKYRFKSIKMFCQMFDYHFLYNKCTSGLYYKPESICPEPEQRQWRGARGERGGRHCCVFKLQEESGNNNLTCYMKQAVPRGAKVVAGPCKQHFPIHQGQDRLSVNSRVWIHAYPRSSTSKSGFCTRRCSASSS